MQVKYEDMEVLFRLLHGQMQEILELGKQLQQARATCEQLYGEAKRASVAEAFHTAALAGDAQ